MKLTTNNYGYDIGINNGYGIRFDVHSQFSWSNSEWAKNVAVFGVDNCSLKHVDHKKIS